MATDIQQFPGPSNWPSASAVVPFEARLDADLEYAVTQGSIFFEDRGAVQETLKRITSRLAEAGIPYAVCGGMALYRHGFRRFTEDVDILVTRESLVRIHELFEGRGYVKPYENSKNLRDTTTGVRIEFLITGQFPGDGKPKELSFPDPQVAADTSFDISVLNIPWLVTLKLASGLSGQNREKDFVDISALIEAKQLPLELADSLPPMVRDKYVELWKKYDAAQPRFVRIFPVEAANVQPTWDAFRKLISSMTDQTSEMEREGISLEWRQLDANRGQFLIATRNSALVSKYKMTPEGEYFLE
jgi:hypothetical protein